MGKIFTIAAAFILFNACYGLAQTDQSLDKKPMPEIWLPFENPVEEELQAAPDEIMPIQTADLSEEAAGQIAYIYEKHLNVLRAQLNDDLITAEEELNEALVALKEVMNDYPEVEGNRQFRELYRSVITEYKEFYGVDKPLNEAYGDIFAVRDEMFMSDENWYDGDIVLPEDIEYTTTDVPLIRNDQVNNHIAYLTQRRPEVMQAWLERSYRYFPMMKEIFEEEGVPTELVHLSMVESGLRPTARSHARAVGMWQFIFATGSVYGLERDWWIDERRDPVKSTRAAARHLRDLHDLWGDWHMAMANYNVSRRRMNWAVRQAGGSRDYWDIFPYLPRETRGYVPGFIAATLIAQNAEEFGFEIENKAEVYSYEVAEVEGSIDLSVLADAAGITTQKLREYNPELLRWATPPGNDPYPLKLPSGTKEQFVENYQQIPEDKREGDMVVHTVSSGESLGAIANRYGTTVRNIYQVNENLSNIIQPGQRIAIPVRESEASSIRSDEPSRARQAQSRSSTRSTRSSSRSDQPANTTAVEYTVRQGDTVGHIAEWFDTQAWRVRSWNNIGNVIRPGQTLRLYVPQDKASQYRQIDNMNFQAKQELTRSGGVGSLALEDSGGSDSYGTYTVRQNDNLTSIANRFNTSVQYLMNINGMSSTRIYVGQTLQVPN